MKASTFIVNTAIVQNTKCGHALSIYKTKHSKLWFCPFIFFFQDNWESPVLGAWGLGWEVWLDGMEVTQVRRLSRLGELGVIGDNWEQ